MRRRAPDPDRQPRVSTRTAALLLLGRRDYTARELHEKLATRGHAADDIARVLTALAEEGLQSDERVAAGFIRTAMRVRGRGRLRIRRELDARGVGKALIERLLAEYGPDDERSAISAILLRKRWPPSPTMDDRRRMFQHLLRRGFSAEAISKALKYRGDDE